MASRRDWEGRAKEGEDNRGGGGAEDGGETAVEVREGEGLHGGC